MTLIINPQPISSFTRGLYDFQRDFYKEAAQDQTISGMVKTNLIGRVLTLGVSLILHAEAVCRAVIICFLSIKETFSQTNEQLLESHKKECSIAYSESLKSFIALFHRQILSNQTDTPVEKPPQLVIQERPPAQLIAQRPVEEELVQQQPGQAEPGIDAQELELPHNDQPLVNQPPIHIELGNVLQDHFAHQDEVVDLDFEEVEQAEQLAEQQAEEELEHVDAEQLAAQQQEDADGVDVVAEVELGQQEDEELEHIDAEQLAAQQQEDADGVAVVAGAEQEQQVDDDLVHVDHAEDVVQQQEEEEVVVVAHHDEFPQQAVHPLQAAGNQALGGEFEVVEHEAPVAAAALPQNEHLVLFAEEDLPPAPPAQQQPAPLAQRLHIEDDYEQEEKGIGQLTADEEARLKEETERDRLRRTTLQTQAKPLTPRSVKDTLIQELADATAQVTLRDRNIRYVVGPEIHYQDPKWNFFSGYVGPLEVGGCHFANDQHALGAQHLATRLTLTIGGAECFAPLFGILDPQIGSLAAQFLVQNLPKALTKYINQFNTQALSQNGVFNGISLAFMKLQSAFIKDNRKAETDDEVIANDGSSATIILMLNNAVWVAHLGNSRAALNNGGVPVQMTTDPDPKNPKYMQLVHSLGGVINSDGLVNGRLGMATGFGHCYLRGTISCKPTITTFALDRIKAGSQLIIGTHGIFDVTSTRRVVGWLQEHRQLEARNLAHDVVYTIHQENQKSNEDGEKNRSLSCLIVRINEMPEPDEWEHI